MTTGFVVKTMIFSYKDTFFPRIIHKTKETKRTHFSLKTRPSQTNEKGVRRE